MFNQNVPAKFQTELDSTYTVDAKSVTRHKPADPSRETTRQEKNIYYLLKSGDGKEVLSYLDKGWKHQSVKVSSGDSFKLVITDKAGESLVFFDMTNKPAVGLTPVDMFMESSGMISANSRFHVGHKIAKML
ncbi:MAG: hypothetical protein ACREK4_11135 [Candidatus Rokuibacteriota bacterium]